jgi:hypothetical protein
LDVADRIRIQVTATPKLKEAIEANRDYVTVETLTVEMNYSEPVRGSEVAEDEFDGEKVKIGMIKV